MAYLAVPLTAQTPFFRLSAELIAALRQRVADRYYDTPQVVEVLARAILCSRGVYPE